MDNPSYRSSLVPRLPSLAGRGRLASSAIRCRFVDRVATFVVAAPVSRQRFSHRDASLPSFGSRRARFPALSGTMKALRLPTRLSPIAHWFAPAAHSDSSGFVFAVALLGRLEVPPRPGLWVGRPPVFPASLVWTRMGSLRSSGDPSRAFAPFQDPGRTNVPSPVMVTSVLPPLDGRRRLRRYLISGLERIPVI